MRAQRARILASTVITLVVAAPAAAQQLRDPEQAGPYPVGVTSMQFDDASRPDAELGPRPLRTEIWYPAVDAARNMPKNKYSEFVVGLATVPGAAEAVADQLNYYKPGLTLADMDRTYKNSAVRDAGVRDGTWPLIVFSHGSGGTRVGYVFLTEFLASHGFIVMSADHIGNSRYTIVNGRVVRSGGPRGQASAADRPKDVSFLIDSMTRLHGTAGNRFSGKVDLTRIGAAGMSFGGSTTINVLEQEKRVRAAVMLAPGGATSARANFTTPIMMMIGTEDSTIRERGNTNNRRYYDESKGPRYFVEIKDGGHFSFTSVDQYNANYGNGIGKGKRITVPDQDVTFLPMDHQHKLINAYALAFFGRHLRGETGYDAFLARNHYGDAVIYKTGH